MKCTIFIWCTRWSELIRFDYIDWKKQQWMRITQKNIPKNDGIPTHYIIIMWCSANTWWWIILNSGIFFWTLKLKFKHQTNYINLLKSRIKRRFVGDVVVMLFIFADDSLLIDNLNEKKLNSQKNKTKQWWWCEPKWSYMKWLNMKMKTKQKKWWWWWWLIINFQTKTKTHTH